MTTKTDGAAPRGAFAPRVIPVATPSKSYRVLVGTRLLDDVGGHVRRVAPGAGKVALVSDSHVAPLYAPLVERSLRTCGLDATTIAFPAGEAHKRLATLGAILDEMAVADLTRDDVVVALGGGVTGDMAGLAAALYLRGIPVVQVPTSLLAMVDSSVGGKTAVDVDAGKNLVGAFWQPSVVLADVGCLATLSPALFADSCGEVIKHAVLADTALLKELTARPLTDGSRTPQELAGIVARNIEIKRDVVCADEREGGLRQTLNLGHTIGHAIEAASEFSLGHGSSVAAGLCCVARGAAALGWTDDMVVRRVVDCVAAHGLPIDTDIPHETLLRFATHDKKRHGDGVNVVIPRSVGAVEVRHVTLDEFARLVDAGCGVTTDA